MKAVVTSNGRVYLGDVPDVQLTPTSVLVQTRYSTVSPGTELGLIANANITAPHPLGYSAVGVVQAVGERVSNISIGETVACYGGPYVFHTRELSVPSTLCAKVPSTVDEQDAAHVGLGAIAIHGVRQASLQFGESVLVLGLGVLGQIIIQVCQQAGYQVIAADTKSERCALAREAGIPYVVQAGDGPDAVQNMVNHVTSQTGVDAVILALHAEKPGMMDAALSYVRPKGTVVVVGNIPTVFEREAFFQKEPEVRISRAGGPGRYDASYERDATDYPLQYVRWTEGRNMKEFLRQLEFGRIRMSHLPRTAFSFMDAPDVYEQLRANPSLMSALFRYHD